MYTVERQGTPQDDKSWYEVMLSPFKTIKECLEYIEKYSQYYPSEYQSYRVKAN